MRCFLLLFLFLFSFLEAMYEGNPTDMYRLTSGLIAEKINYRFHSGYVYDNIYDSTFYEKFDPLAATSKIKVTNQLALVGLDLYGYVGFYGFVGASQLKLDNLITTSEAFAWAGGMKVFFFRYKGLTAALDGRYFRTTPAVDYLISSNVLLPVASTPKIRYDEVQGACIFSYAIGPCMPYGGVSYILGQMEPFPPNILLRVPGSEELFEVQVKTNVNHKKWGAVVGLMLVAKGKASLSCEARFVNQSAISAALDLRF